MNAIAPEPTSNDTSKLLAILACHELPPPPGSWKRVRPRCPFPGQCYQRSLSFLIANANQVERLALIHGAVISGPDGSRIGHAWVEIDGAIVFDATLQRFYDRAGFLSVVGGEVVVAYTGREAAAALVDTGHAGPWESLLKPAAALGVSCAAFSQEPPEEAEAKVRGRPPKAEPPADLAPQAKGKRK